MTTKSEKALRIAWSNRCKTDTWITLRSEKSGTCDLFAGKIKNPIRAQQTMPKWLENKRRDGDQKNQLGFPCQHLRIFFFLNPGRKNHTKAYMSSQTWGSARLVMDGSQRKIVKREGGLFTHFIDAVSPSTYEQKALFQSQPNESFMDSFI